jgi:hypothetical protein
MNADIKAKKCRFDLCIGYERRIHRVTKKSQGYEALNIEVQYSKKRLGESIENQWIVLSLGFFSFPLCPKSLKDSFLRPEFTKGSLKKVAKYGKIETSQKKEVLQWRKKKSMKV